MVPKFAWWGLMAVLLLSSAALPVRASGPYQQTPEPTATFATNLSGATATVNSDDQEEINVRAGPGIDYALVGKLLAGQTVPATGRSVGGDWVRISYPQAPGGVGWVYAYLVTISGSPPLVEPPPTPTPRVTPTVDQTLAAQFIQEIPATRMPTFTPPAPLAIPTFVPEGPSLTSGGAPYIYLMIGLGIIGIIFFLLSFVRTR